MRPFGFQLNYVLPPMSCLLNGCCAVLCHDQIRHAMLHNVAEQHARFCWPLRGGAASKLWQFLHDGALGLLLSLPCCWKDQF